MSAAIAQDVLAERARTRRLQARLRWLRAAILASRAAAAARAAAAREVWPLLKCLPTRAAEGGGHEGRSLLPGARIAGAGDGGGPGAGSQR